MGKQKETTYTFVFHCKEGVVVSSKAMDEMDVQVFNARLQHWDDPVSPAFFYVTDGQAVNRENVIYLEILQDTTEIEVRDPTGNTLPKVVDVVQAKDGSRLGELL